MATAPAEQTPYFTREHFDLLRTWGEKEKTTSAGPMQDAYEQLSRAYAITEAWADAVQQALFPDGYVSVRKRPTNQGNHFTSYNWARIYPTKGSPKKLAYTVGIDSENGFVVKIDTVGLVDNQPVRAAYSMRSMNHALASAAWAG
jgi:5-methylcytosine-specific restriction enzyme B